MLSFLTNKIINKRHVVILVFTLLVKLSMASEERREEGFFNHFFTVEGNLPDELKEKMLAYMTEEHIWKLEQVSRPWQHYVYEHFGNSGIRTLRRRILSLVTAPDPYQRIKQSLREISLKLSPQEQIIFEKLLGGIVPPQKKLSSGINLRNRFEFLQKPHDQHLLFASLHEHISFLENCKVQLRDHRVRLNIDRLIEHYNEFIVFLVKETQSLGVHTPVHLSEVKPYLQGERIEPYQLDTEQAYKVVSHDLLGKLQKLNEAGNSPVVPIGGVHFKVDSGGMLLNPARESAVYQFYRQVIGFGITPTLLMSIHDLTMLSPHAGNPRLKQILAEEREKLGGISEEELFRRKPELEILMTAELTNASFMIQASLSVKGKGFDKFLEEVERGHTSYDYLDRKSFSSHILASLLLNPTDYKSDNLMVDEQGRIIGIDNDQVLEGKELRVFRKNEHAPNVCNILYCLPLMQEPVEDLVRSSFLKHPPALSLLAWLQELKRHEKQYDTYFAKQFSSQQAKNKKLELNMPLKFVPGSISWMYEQWIKLQRLLQQEEHITHEQLFKELQPLAYHYYQGLKKFSNNPIGQLNILYHAKDTHIYDKIFLESMFIQHPRVEDEYLKQLLSKTPFKKESAELTIEDAIQELISSVNLTLYSPSQKLWLLERVLEGKIFPSAWHESWRKPQLLVEVTQQGADKHVLNFLVKDLRINVNTQDENERTSLHYAANGNVANCASLEQIETLVRLGADLEAQDKNKSTPLDLAADKKNEQVFAKLVTLGAGKKAILNKIRRYYKNYFQHNEKDEIFQRLAQTNPELGWYIALDTLLPIGTHGEHIRTPIEGDRLVTPEFLDKIFDVQGKIRKTNAHGRRAVAQLQNGPYSLHVKIYPELPGMELAVSRLIRVLGYEAPYSELGEIRGHPVLLTQTISDDTLYEVVRNKPERLKKLDPYYLSMALIMAMLTNPEDGNPTNHIVSLINKEGEESYKIISIDHDHSFMPAVAREVKKGKPSLQVKSILFSLEAMKEKVHPDVVNHFKALNPINVLKRWLQKLDLDDQKAKAHFVGDMVIELAKNKDTIIGVPFIPGMLTQLYTKMVRLQMALAKKKIPTHLELLSILEPALGLRYERAHLMTHSLSVWERFKSVDGDFYTINQQGDIMSTASLAEVLESSSLPDKETLQKALWKNEYGPKKALSELKNVENQFNSYEQILKNLKEANPTMIKDIQVEGLQEILTNHISFEDLSFGQQKVLLTGLQGKELRQLCIRNAIGLTNDIFQKLNLSHVSRVNLSGCLNLKFCSKYKTIGKNEFLNMNALQTLNIIGCSELIDIRLKAPLLRKVRINSCPSLKSIEIKSEHLDEVDLSQNTKLEHETLASFLGNISPFNILKLEGCPNIALHPNLPFDREKYGVAMEYYKKSLKDDTNAQYNLGMIYYWGHGVVQDYMKAREWFAKAAKQNDAIAQLNLGVIHYHGKGVDQDYMKAREWFAKAAEQNNVMAQYNLGVTYYFGQGVDQDYVKAREWFFKAAEQNYPIAYYTIGLLTYKGLGLPQDEQKAQFYFQKAYELFIQKNEHDLSYVQHTLGEMYRYGRGVKKELQKAIEWYQKAINQNYSRAQASLGSLYKQTQGNFEEALRLIELAVEQKDPEGLYNLGLMYRDGEGVPQNDQEAIKLFELAAEQKYEPAFYSLGWMYEQGRGVEKDVAKAQYWYAEGAKRYPADAFYSLGRMYELGLNVEKDLEKAVTWYKEAALLHHEDAKEKILNLLPTSVEELK